MMLPSIFGKDLFDDFFGYPFYTDRDWKKAEKQAYTKRNDLMKTDVRETEDAYQLEMDLPGYKKDEVKVALEKGYLTIHAVKEEKKEEKDEKTGKYIRQERFTGACQRSFYVGENLTEADIKGEFKDGILTLTIPKKEEKPKEEKQYITIEG
ncbi:MAG: Hsp20/alpha crystallin family protein [Anaerostipes sp.]|nr:Hsp20/alpha crystallin family protein [Anaerostipes sp.]